MRSQFKTFIVFRFYSCSLIMTFYRTKTILAIAFVETVFLSISFFLGCSGVTIGRLWIVAKVSNNVLHGTPKRPGRLSLWKKRGTIGVHRSIHFYLCLQNRWQNQWKSFQKGCIGFENHFILYTLSSPSKLETKSCIWTTEDWRDTTRIVSIYREISVLQKNCRSKNTRVVRSKHSPTR